jgi:hypothetical protein
VDGHSAPETTAPVIRIFIVNGIECRHEAERLRLRGSIEVAEITATNSTFSLLNADLTRSFALHPFTKKSVLTAVCHIKQTLPSY